MAERALIWWIVEAFENLGRRAHLRNVYDEVRRLGYVSGGDLEKNIRARIYEHSSDSDKWTKNPNDDLFRSPKIRSGNWELREEIARDIEEPVNAAIRTTIRVSRIIRDNALIRELKALHAHCCQLCGEFIALPDGRRYSEGHHLRPLGKPHNGPDVRSNVVILCPNHHAMCDLGAIRLDASSLRPHEEHGVDLNFIDYHNEVIAEDPA